MAETPGPESGDSTLSIERLSIALADRYAIEREVGRGGMAVVYLAEDLKHERKVAVKVLNPDLSASIGGERFLREIQIAAKLQHPHILPLYDSGEADGLLYYVMPYVEGETVRELIEREQQLPMSESIRIATEVAGALAYAHDLGIVHRDIKPSNILLSGGHAVVADFGIARAISEAGTAKLTSTGQAVGTPHYMSPEQAAGQTSLDGRADTYALGCVLYEMLAGEPPFTGPTPQSVMARHVIDPVPPLRTVRPAVSRGIETVIERAMAKVPADRFATLSEFSEALAAPGAVADSGRERTPGSGRSPRKWLAAAALVLVVVAAAVATTVVLTTRPDSGASSGRIRLVVLPFRNLGSPDDEYFTEGITEEITGRLASIGRLGVIARTSAMQYKDSRKSISDIGEELDVEYVIEGSVRRATPGVTADSRRNATQLVRLEGSVQGATPGATADSMRIGARLIRVEDGTQAWAYDRNADLADVFEVQASIAEQVAVALNIELGEPERRQVAARPTTDLQAYDYYLRGNQFYNRSWERADVEQALAMYQRATELDPDYALAFAQAGKTHTWIHRLLYDATEGRLRQARAAIERALELDPDLAEAHISMGLYHYWGHWDYESAIEELSRARTIQPDNAWIYLQIGNIRRRQGEWADAIANYERAGDLDPRFHIIRFNIAEVHYVTREYEEARRYVGQALTLAPDYLDSYLEQAAVAVLSDGDVAEARRIMDTAADHVPPSNWRQLNSFWLSGPGRVLNSAAELDARLAPGTYGLDRLYALVRAETNERLGRVEEARAWYDSARVVLETARTRESPQPWIHAALGVAYAGLGRTEEALESAHRAMELSPVSRDAFDGPDWIVNMARVQMMVGQTQEAITNLGLALDIPSRISTELVRLDPIWEPLRAEPGFQALLETDAPAGTDEERPDG
jgi:serine/threonine-protein kinase